MSLELSSTISFDEGDFVELPLSLMQEGVMPVVHVKGDAARTIGTCFAISGDGLCMTARHVIEEVSEFTGKELDLESQGYIAALFVSGRYDTEGRSDLFGGLLPMLKAYTQDGLDVALLHLNLPTNTATGERLQLPQHGLRLLPPTPGELCFAMGYPKGDWLPRPNPPNYSLDQRFCAARGLVEEVHIPRRDAVVLPFPCFRTSARLDSGMSGGPIIDANGAVIGVVCSSYDLEADAPPVSYGSLIFPTLGIGIEGARTAGPPEQLMLVDFIEGGAVRADSDRVRVERTSGGFNFVPLPPNA